jgi:hypothetical protein
MLTSRSANWWCLRRKQLSLAFLHEPSLDCNCHCHSRALHEPQNTSGYHKREAKTNGLVYSIVLLSASHTECQLSPQDRKHDIYSFHHVCPSLTFLDLKLRSCRVFIMGLVWGGQQFAWNSAHVLATLIVGGVGLVAWYFVEKYYCEYPTVPFKLLMNRTTLIGYFTTFVHGILALTVFFYW